MDEQRSKIRVAALADSQELRLASTGVLAGNQSQPSRELPAIREVSRVVDRGHDGTGGDRADARYCLQFSAELTLAMPREDLLLELLNSLVQANEILEQVGDEDAKEVR